MASDQIVWDIINGVHCSFKTKTRDRTFCRNEYNVTGLCGRQTCPLANSRYATIRSDPENPALLHLYTKTVERAHLPSRLWERTTLSSNYAKALEQVDSQLMYWPKFLVHKCKQRLTRLTQVALRMKRLEKEEIRIGEKTVSRLAPKVRRREETRERKAERAAKIERAIERELIERLRSGAYGDKPLNVEEGIWQKVLRGLERGGEAERDREAVDEEEEEGELEMEKELEGGDVEYVSDIDGESDEEFEDLEDWQGRENRDADSNSEDEDGSEDSDEDGSSGSSEDDDDDEDDTEKLKKALASLKRKRPPLSTTKPAKKKTTKGPKQEIEYEIEHEPPIRDAAYA